MNRPRPGDSPTARYGRASGGAVRSTPERPDTTHLYDLNGQPLKVSNVDAGWRLSLPGLAGQTVQRWDARGVHWRNRYDELLRLVSISNSADPLSDTFTYADASAPADHNQRGRLLEQLDPSGSLHLDSYSLAGQPLRERRTFTDAREFVTQRIFSPLDAVLEQTDAGGHRQQSRYDLAGQLKQLQLLLAGTTPGKRCCSTRTSTPPDRSSRNRPAMALPLLAL
jgi:insecticidal toxin complex protein TccC